MTPLQKIAPLFNCVSAIVGGNTPTSQDVDVTLFIIMTIIVRSITSAYLSLGVLSFNL